VWFWWWAACAGGDVDGGPVDVAEDSADSPTEPPAVHVALTPSPKWADGLPLRCEVDDPAAIVRWTLDGAPYAGPVSSSGAGADGDQIPAYALAPRQVWSCEAARGAVVAASEPVTVRPPSVVVVMVDDLGWGDLGANGSRVATPRLDTLASQGLTFDRAYVASPVCGPSRAALMTGRQGVRTGFEYNLGEVPDEGLSRRGLAPGERTLGEVWGDAGLVTAAVGKWHLGQGAEHAPSARGFGHFFGILDGRHMPLPPDTPGMLTFDVRDDELATWPVSPTGEVVQSDGVPVPPDSRHLTDVFADEAVRWLGEHAGEDVGLYLAFTAPHLPLMATPEMLAAVPGSEDSPLRWVYDATVHHLDAAVGRVLDALEADGRADHTVVFFLSDNGCLSLGDVCSNGPFQGGKLLLAEGGVRTPMIARRPGVWQAGGRVGVTVSALDLLPTLAPIVGGALPAAELDGVDLSPWLRGEGSGTPHPSLWWRQIPARAVLEGDTKVVQVYDQVWRFNIAEDPGERQDLHADDPAGTQPWLDAMDARALSTYMSPAWPGQWAPVSYYGTPVAILF
jgi:arylsulfatase A-like enzyme